MKLIRGFLFENDKLQMVFYRIGMRKRIIVCKVSLLLVLKSKIPEGKSYFRLDRLNIMVQKRAKNSSCICRIQRYEEYDDHDEKSVVNYQHTHGMHVPIRLAVVFFYRSREER